MDWSEIEDAPPGDEVRWLMRGWMTPQKRRRRMLALRRYHESELAWAEARVEQMKGALRQINEPGQSTAKPVGSVANILPFAGE